MEWDNIPVRRSSRLQTIEIPNPPTLPEPQEDEEGLPMQSLQDLPDLGPGVELAMLPEMDVFFNKNYLSSQEPRLHYCASDEDEEEYDHDMSKGGGLESILWPPEMLQQAHGYGKQKKRKQSRGLLQFHEHQNEARAIEICNGASTSRDPDLSIDEENLFHEDDFDADLEQSRWLSVDELPEAMHERGCQSPMGDADEVCAGASAMAPGRGNLTGAPAISGRPRGSQGAPNSLDSMQPWVEAYAASLEAFPALLEAILNYLEPKRTSVEGTATGRLARARV